jgi:uncharacterized membrane protein YphA (DoxX/SURF4 family)
LFLVLLRMAIGWHFLYEGIEKIYSTPEGRDSALAYVLRRPSKPEPPFSAEGYLRNATGPLAPHFRGLVPDVDGLERLDQGRLEARWKADLERYARHYEFDQKQRAEAEKELNSRLAVADAWFHDPENVDKVRKYRNDLAHIDKVLADPNSLSFERERAYDARRELEATRRDLVGTVDAWTQTLHDAWRKLSPKEQAERVGPPPALRTRLDWINITTMGGMVAVGVCLMLGLFTPLAALGAAAYLSLFYLSMPPWPHIPPGPMAEGHYLFVNKNLIELLACLVLASTPNGHWIGLDALLFGWIGRRRAARAERADAAGPPVLDGPRVAVPTKSSQEPKPR